MVTGTVCGAGVVKPTILLKVIPWSPGARLVKIVPFVRNGPVPSNCHSAPAETALGGVIKTSRLPVAAGAFVEMPKRMALFWESATKTSPNESKATPNGRSKLALVPVPSLLPCAPPAMVKTCQFVEDGTISRMASLKESATNTSSLLSTAKPTGASKRAFVPSPLEDPEVGWPAMVVTTQLLPTGVTRRMALLN